MAQAVQLWPQVEDQLSRWRVYCGGLKLIQDLLGDIECVLPPAGYLSELKLLSSSDDYQVTLN